MLFADWKINKGNPKGRFIMTSFRLAVLIRSNKFLLIFLFWYLFLHILLIEWLIGSELTLNVKIGKNFQIWHGHSIVLNPGVVIGDNCTIRHCTTIGNKGEHTGCPTIGSNVNIGSNVVIIGDIHIGDNVIIGAGSVITKSVPNGVTIVGNPSRIIKFS